MTPTIRNTVSYSRGYRRGQGRPPKRKEGCYICGDNHFWKYCPQKRCPACGQKGHKLQDCKSSKSGRDGHRVFVARTDQSSPELSVVLSVKINGNPVTVILDSGAGPSVLDYETLSELGLTKYLQDNSSQIYGLSQAPVTVIGSADLTVDLGDNQVTVQRFQITDAGSTHILGRDLLKKFGTTEFDWETRRVRLGNTWKESRAAIEGGEPLSRATIGLLEVNLTEEASYKHPFLINTSLSNSHKEKINRLLNQYQDVFAINPKKPAVTNKIKHKIDTRNSQPVKCKFLRVAPAVEREINTQVR